jgi:uncharacterized protein YbaR (Trm112 family)
MNFTFLFKKSLFHYCYFSEPLKTYGIILYLMEKANWILEALVCPECKSELSLKSGKLACKKCKARYSLKDNIPNLMPKSI